MKLLPYALLLVGSSVGAQIDIPAKMEEYGVTAVSVAVVHEGKIAWAKGFGHVTEDPQSRDVDEHTLFQAASLSKPITAFGALLLVQQGRIGLDEDVNRYLKRWKVPENRFTQNEKVTLRRLLSHSAGVNIHGFGGYALQEPVPNLVEVLQGVRTHTPPIRVNAIPGTQSRYSGGGLTIVQLLIEEITGERFDRWMKQHVLDPIGMVESTFAQPLPPGQAEHAAHGYRQGGIPVEGGWQLYPALAAGGLWTTPKDLAQFILYIQRALREGHAEPLNTPLVHEMVTRQRVGNRVGNFGLGLALRNQGPTLIFHHNGRNAGFISNMFGYAYQGEGLVIMVDSIDGLPLVREISASLFEEYGW